MYKFDSKKISFLLLLLITLSFQSVSAQIDSLVFKGKNVITGEIKGMSKGVLEIDAPYNDDNFKIKWLDVKEIYTTSFFTVVIGNDIYQGRIATTTGNKVKIFDDKGVYMTCDLEDIVDFSQFKNGFKNRFDASIEFGFNLAKAQSLKQFSSASKASYKTDKWTLSASYNLLRSSQTATVPIRRVDGLLAFNRYLFHSWYFTASISTLSNSEQLIDIRANTKIGMGNFIFKTNRAYWGVNLGINNNLERFDNETTTSNSWEATLGTELNLYDIGDLELLFSVNNYLGLSNRSRYRADLNFNLKYDLPLDFFISTGIQYNYDNQPATDASQSDYVFTSGFGWEW